MKKILTAVICILLFSTAKAQQIPFYSQYYINPFIYNPSMTGFGENINAYLIHRSQWKDIPGSPVTNALTIDGPVNGKNIGLGLSFFNDVTDIIERTGIYSSYSYRIPVNDDSRVLFGLSLGILDHRINFEKISAKDVADPVIVAESQRKAVADATFGVSYLWKDLEVGLAIPQLLGNSVRFPETQARAYYNFSRHFLGSVKYTYMINEEKGMSVYPLALVRYTPGAPFQFDGNAVFNWQKMGWAAISYKHDYAIGVNIGIRIKENLSVGYSYDVITGSLKSAAVSGHEILLGYRFSSGGGGAAHDPAKEQELSELQNRLTASEAEIERLNTEVAALKTSGEATKEEEAPATGDGSTQEAQSNVTNEISDGSIRKGLSLDFEDENENMAVKGDYIVVGSFKNKENAYKSKAKYVAEEFSDAKVVYNTRIGFYNVYVSNPPTSEAAVEELSKVRAVKPDAWILRLE